MKIGGFSYHYIDEGPLDSEGKKIEGDPSTPTLLLVHGNPTWSFMWRDLIKAFRTKYRVISIDHIGCGLSEKPSEKDYPYTMDRRISDLSTFVQKLNLQPVVLVAHDWGGLIGLGAAERTPKRFSKLVLMNTAAFVSDYCPLRIRLCRIPLLNRLLLQAFNIFPAAAARMASSQRGGLAPEVRAGMMAPYNSWANRVGVFQFVQDIPMSEKHRSRKRLETIEKELTLFRDTPVALIWGMQDWCFGPDYIKKFLQYYPTAFVHRIERAGHYLLEDTPDEVIETIQRFLENE